MVRRVLARPGTRQTGTVGVMLLLVVLAACGGGSHSQIISGGGGGGGSTVAPFFFGMHINSPNSPFPSTAGVPVSGVRLWDTQTSWATTNTSPGNYDWSSFDSRVNQALSNKVDVLYDFARTPLWAQCASSNTACGSGDTTVVCAYATIPPPEGGPGECFPPNDLNVDGSGSNQHWIDWVTAVVSRYKGKISYYEIWNEPNNSAMWQGTNAQLVRLAGDARCIIVGDKGCNLQSAYSQKGIDPSAKVLTPGWGNPIDSIAPYLATPLNGGTGTGISFADIAAFHGYPGQSPPEQVLKIFNTLSTPLQGSRMPVFDTEGSWGGNNGIPSISDPDQQAAFTARYLLVQESAGIERLYWYGWDLIKSDNGDLWTPGGLTLAGVAYQQTELWVSGATLSTPCSASGSVWTCSYTRPGGYQALVVWDQSQTCRNGSCTSSSFSLPSSPQFIQYQDLARNVHSVTGSVAIGAKPILLETGNIP